MTSAQTPQPRLHIDWTRCDGRGLCIELLPSLLRRDPWGYPLARDGSREPEITAGTLGDARAAAARCPRLALSVVAPVANADQRRAEPRHRRR
jgi:ferredoxin